MSQNSITGYANELMEETLLESATTFFGARRGLESEIEAYRNAAEELTRVEQKVFQRAAALHTLLLTSDATQEFYTLLGVTPGHLLDAADLESPNTSGVKYPFALTMAGRYGKLLHAAYAQLTQSVESYLHGEYWTDSKGRKRLTVNYQQMEEWCGKLNEKIEALNNNHSPSGTLCFVKGLDPSLLEKEQISEATMNGYAEELDRELAFQPIECLTINYLAAPELPGPETVKSLIVSYGKALYRKAPTKYRKQLLWWKTSANTRD